MAELAPQDRLQPALLDRLTDEEPLKRVEPVESRVISKSKLRQATLRDLAWLFNTTQLDGEDLAGFPFAERSVINFGLPALSGQTASTLDAIGLETAIKRAILDFEPRILADTLRVEALITEAQLDQHNMVSVQIQGQLWAQPVPLELLLRTEVDLETGRMELRDLGQAGLR
ncbi:MAG: type VI secretion system baseplate subunit TssE [Pseudolabrys sp.]